MSDPFARFWESMLRTIEGHRSSGNFANTIPLILVYGPVSAQSDTAEPGARLAAITIKDLKWLTPPDMTPEMLAMLGNALRVIADNLGEEE